MTNPQDNERKADPLKLAVEALEYAKACFDAAEVEGLSNVLALQHGDEIWRLKDLVERRLMFAIGRIEDTLSALTAAPPAQLQVAEADLAMRVRVLAEKWTNDAIADGFAGSEPANELFDVLDAAATPQAEAQQAKVDLVAQGQAEQQCICSMHTKLVGDGCAVCNPKLAAEIAAENALQALVDEAQKLDMGYGPNACPTCGRSGDGQAQKIEELGMLCAEAYQVIGVLADETGRFDDEKTIKIMDNLSDQKMIHDDVLPYPSGKAAIPLRPDNTGKD